MKERIYNTLNIKASESKQVFDLLSVQFFLGLATALLNIISFTLFIYTFSVNVLPQVYLTIAVVLVVLNFFYEKLEHKLSPLQLLQIVIGISIAILVASWTGLTFGVKTDFIFILMVANTIIYMLTGYAYWGLVSLLFNVRESRRVFSIVGSGDIPAKLIGYMVAPFLIPLIGLPNLVWVAILSLGASLFLFNKVIRKKSWDHIRKSHGHETHEVHTAKKQDIVSFFFKNKLIFTISLLSVLSYNVFILIDYTFIAQVKLRFENVTNLALYVSAFFAVGRVIAIAFKLIFTSRVIERLGIISSLFITPIALFLFCMLFFIYQGYSNYNIFIFGIMALLSEVLRSSMQEPVFFILFQPLKEQLRLKGHIIAKGYTLPPSLLVVGLTLLLFIKWNIPITILLTVKIILINLLVWGSAIFLIQKAYLKTLHRSILKGTFSSDDQYVYDQTTINILLHKIKTGKNAEVIYALDLLEKSGYAGLPELLHQQLMHTQPEVKKYSLEQLEKTGKADTARLKKILPDEKDAEVRQKIVSILCKQDAAYLDEVSDDFRHQDYDTKKIIIINLLNHHEFDYLFKAGNEINNLINSDNAEERHLAISIIAELKHVHFTNAITKLINDPEVSVKRSAVMAACKLKISTVLPLVLNLSHHTNDKYLVIKALQQYGDKLFEDIQSLPQNIIHSYTPDFIKIASNIKGEHSKKFLLSTMDELNHQTNKTVHALWIQNYEPDDEKSITNMQALLNKYLKTGISKITDHHNTPDYAQQKEIVKKSLVTEIKTDLIVSLKICSMLFKKKQISRILELIEMEKQHQLYNAMEMIEMELPKKISKDLIYLFDFILDPSGNKLTVGKNDTASLFSRIYLSDSFTYNPWTKAIVIYCSWKNSITEDLKIIRQKQGPSEHLIITETRDFVLKAVN
jgi:ATP:ADP antiporter, AAA family